MQLTYISPNDSKYYKLANIDPFERLEAGVRRYSELGELPVMGDLSAKAGDNLLRPRIIYSFQRLFMSLPRHMTSLRRLIDSWP